MPNASPIDPAALDPRYDDVNALDHLLKRFADSILHGEGIDADRLAIQQHTAALVQAEREACAGDIETLPDTQFVNGIPQWVKPLWRHAAQSIRRHRASDAVPPQRPHAMRDTSWITLTNASAYRPDLPIYLRRDVIAGVESSAHMTYTTGNVPTGLGYQTLVYTIGGNQFTVQESADEVLALLQAHEVPHA